MFDLCVNFSSPGLSKKPPEQLLAQARGAGVEGVCAVGTSLHSSRVAAKLAREYGPFLRASAGLHPHKARDWSAQARQEFRALLLQNPSLCAGECGLDYFRMLSTKSEQSRAFGEQLDLAAELGRPVILHERDAFADMVDHLKEAGRSVRGVVHCFTGTSAQAQTYLEMGLDLGVTGWVADLRRAAAVREAVLHIPLDRLHLETDAPYLLPRNMPKSLQKSSNGTNSPEYLPWVVREVAHLLRLPVAEVAAQTAQNSIRLLGFTPRCA